MATTPECAYIGGHADGFDPECAWCQKRGNEIRAIMDEHVEKGNLIKNADGSYSPTPLGRLVAKAGGKN